MTDLVSEKSQPLPKGTPALSPSQIKPLAAQVVEWDVSDNIKNISRSFKFKNYYETVAFINAVVWIVHQEDHHPDIEFGYNQCTISFSTHSVGGLSKNDFICAAKINALLNITA